MNPSGIDGIRYVNGVDAQWFNLWLAILAVNLVNHPNHCLPACRLFTGGCRYANAKAKVGVLGEVVRINLVYRSDDVRAGANHWLHHFANALGNRFVIFAPRQWVGLTASKDRQEGGTERSRPHILPVWRRRCVDRHPSVRSTARVWCLRLLSENRHRSTSVSVSRLSVDGAANAPSQ